MKLTETFAEAIQHADQLVHLYDHLTTKNRRAIRTEWADRFFAARLTTWPKGGGLWRSKNDNVLIIGTQNAQLSHNDFKSEALLLFLRAALVMSMAAIDKILHEAVSKHFVSLVRKEKLDDIVDLELSKSYRIALESRKRTGQGGKVRSRPGPRIKSEVLGKIYRDSFLSSRRLQQITAACGKRKIFEKYGKTITPRKSSKNLQERWEHLYTRRNQIAHECDIVQKSKAKKVHFHITTSVEMKEDIAFVRDFGTYLAKELE